MDQIDMKQPVQSRSKKTHNDLLDALEQLLCEQPITSLTVAEIASKAGLTTGAIYRRFKDKRSLLHAAFVRFLERAEQDIQSSSGEFDQDSDEEVLKFVINKLLYDTLDYIPLMQAATSLNDLPSFEKMVTARNMVADQLAASLTRSKLSQEPLKRRCRFVIRMVTAVIRDTFMAGQGSWQGVFSKEKILRERKETLNRLIDDLISISSTYLQLENQPEIPE